MCYRFYRVTTGMDCTNYHSGVRACPGFLKGGSNIFWFPKKGHQILKGLIGGGVQYINSLPKTTNLVYLDAKGNFFLFLIINLLTGAKVISQNTLFDLPEQCGLPVIVNYNIHVGYCFIHVYI